MIMIAALLIFALMEYVKINANLQNVPQDLHADSETAYQTSKLKNSLLLMMLTVWEENEKNDE